MDMHILYFAGAVLSTKDVALYSAAAFLVIGFFPGLVIFYGKRMIAKPAKQLQMGTTRNRLARSFLIGYLLLGAVALLFVILPTLLRDNNWQNKQKSCAAQVGYNSPADDNSSKATAESQDAYRACLDR